MLSSLLKLENRAAPKTARATPAVAMPPITAAVLTCKRQISGRLRVKDVSLIHIHIQSARARELLMQLVLPVNVKSDNMAH